MKRILLMCTALVMAILLNAPRVLARQQNRNVTGKVVTIDGQPIEGVNVQLKGKNRGTVTNALGVFNINNVAPNDILAVAFIGYATQEIPLKGRRELTVTLIQNMEKLEEVVVVGYGTIAKSDFTGSSSTVNLEGAENNRFISPLEALQGRLAGVQITTSSGEPGAGISFNVRGVTSISGNGRPLIVIDGQPIEASYGSARAGMGQDSQMDTSPMDPLAGLNPGDIESVEVLKDASSTAIYGSRGANGVVLIKTKSGKLGKDKVIYSGRTDYNAMPKYINVLNAREFMAFYNEASINNGADSVYKQYKIDSIANVIDFDWQKEVLKSSFSQNHQLSVSGRDDRNGYLISGNYTDQNSLIQNAGFKRYGLRINYDRKVSDKLSIALRSNISIMNRNYGVQSNAVGLPTANAVLGSLIFSPIRSAYTDDGELDGAFTNNPVLITTRIKDNSKIRSLIANLTLTYNFNRFLKYSLTAGVNDMYTLRNVYHPLGTQLGEAAPNGAAARADNGNSNYLMDHLLSYNRTLKGKHRINAVAGFSYQYWDNRASGVVARDFPSDALGYENLQSANAPGIMYTSYQNRALKSTFARVNYAYNTRYLLTLTGRADGSSRLAEGHKWGIFYSAGIGWNLHNEKFFPASLRLINNLKLRANYGVSGMENISIGATQAAYGINYVNFGTAIQPGYVQANFANPNLGWEVTNQVNVGVDVGLAKNRFTFSVDLYRKETNDLLINLLLPPSATYGGYTTNLGNVLNKGIDFEGAAKVLTGAVKLDLGVNMSFLNNKVVHMGPLESVEGNPYFGGGSMLLGQPVQIALPGHSIPSYWGYKTNGIYQNQQEIDNDPALANDASKSSIKPGMVKWVDVNGDGRISDADKTIIGNPFPDFTYGFNINMSYKKFSLSASFMGSKGNEMLNLNRWILDGNSTQGGFTLSEAAYRGAWRGEGTSNLYPQLQLAAQRLQQRFPDWMVEDASFFRMQSLTVGYTFKLPKSIGISSSLRAYLSGTNLFTITKYSGYDPAINAFAGSLLNSGADLGTLPQPRTYSLGVELSF